MGTVQAMKAGMRQLASGVCVISTVDVDTKERLAMTVSSVTSVSDKPPSLLVGINQKNKIAECLKPGTHFNVNVLSQHHETLSMNCASPREAENWFSIGEWDDNDFGVPYVADALAVFECVVDQMYAYGTHNITIGRILSTNVLPHEEQPLIYCSGKYHRLESLAD